MFNTGLYWANGHAHANVIIFDTAARVIERYEPGGMLGHVRNLKETFERMFPGWAWIGARQMRKGAQHLADSFSGMCVTFSLYYTLLRLTNPNETPMQIYKFMDNQAKTGKLRTAVLRLNKYAETVLSRLKRHSLDNVRSLSIPVGTLNARVSK